MGILDIFRKKKPVETPKEPQHFSQSSTSEQNKSDITIVDIAGTARINHPIYVKQINESTEIIRNTTNPETFFSRYKFAIERLTELEGMRKYVKLTCNPLEIRQNLINDKDKYITLLIKRMYEKTEAKIKELKQQKAIQNNIDLFISSVEDFSEEMGELSEKYFKEVSELLKSKYIDSIKIETVPVNDIKECGHEKTVQENQNVNLNINNSDSYWEQRFKELRKMTEKSYPSCNGLKIPDIMVLEYAETFTTEIEEIHSFWYYEYGLELKDIHNILNMLIQKKLIQTSSVQETIKKFTIPKIKELLKELGLKLSGKKAELLDRLFENAPTDFLENKVTSRGFIITDTGKQELKENDYVIYFHRRNNGFCINLTVWKMNKLLHDNPSKNYREIMWEEFQKQYSIEAHEIRINGYTRYTSVCNYMCTFLLESKGNAEIALKYFAESVYYAVNYSMLRQYNYRMKLYKSMLKEAKNQKREFTELPPEIYDFIYIDESNFNKIKDELEISDDEFCRRLDDIFFNFHLEKPLLSDSETAKFVMANVNNDYEILDKMKYVIDNFTTETNKF